MDPSPDFPRPDSAATRGLLDRAADGDPAAAGELLAHHRLALVAFVELHLDPRVAARLDPSDVVQEAQADTGPADRRLPGPAAHAVPPVGPQDRLRAAARRPPPAPAPGPAGGVAGGAVARPARPWPWPARSWPAGPSPSQAAEAREFARTGGRGGRRAARGEPGGAALCGTSTDCRSRRSALLLGIDPAAARKRYGRALIRLQKVLTAAGLLEDVS